MSHGKSRKIGKYLAALSVAGAVAAFFILLGPPRLLAKSEAPIFCGGCHVMEAQFEAWSHAGAHRRKNCVDCHLPNRNMVAHYIWKSIDGLKDAGFFYSGLAPDRIRITDHGRKVLQTNCIRCHEATVDMIGHDRQCWDCHRRIAHRRTGAIETL
ncbi:MAG: cytochrome c nitrite reductase small subunit [Nitrospirae bacterium]|nr:cytochrome c nitrite reductase small subunit [Nitrospirota bacterium]